MNAPVRLAIVGAAGRMGRALIAAGDDEAAVTVRVLVEHAESPSWRDGGLELRPRGASILQTDTLDAAVDAFDVLIDFTRPEATLTALEACAAAGKPAVVGTTGFDAAQRARIAEIAKRIPVCLSANYSIGVNVCLKLLADAAKALGEDYDVEIVEAHHRHKVDAPSGTALAMGETVATALGRDLAQAAVYGREGQVGARKASTIGFATVRGGDVVGDHRVLFLGEGETVEIAHRASSRANFARGALRAAAWLAEPGRAPGLYSMRDVLGL